MKTNSMISTEALNALNKFVEKKAGFSDRVIETDSATVMECIKFIERVFSDVVVVLCAHDRVSYVSQNCMQIIGYDSACFKSLSLGDTLELLHEEDIKGFKTCIDKIAGLPIDQHDAYKFLIQYRMKNPLGGYHFLEDEKIAVQTRPGKFVFLTLLRNLSNQAIFSGVKLVIQKKVKDKFITLHEYASRASSHKRFSARQLEIVELVSKGYSNKAIASKLNVTLSTVKNHKQLLFKKINVRSNIEMLNLMKGGTS